MSPIRKYVSPSGRQGWHIDIRRVIDGKPLNYRKVVYCSRSYAEKIERTKLRAFEDETFLGVKHSLSLNELWKAYLPHAKQTKKSWKDDQGRIRRLLDLYGDWFVTSITLEHLAAYQAQRSAEHVMPRFRKNGTAQTSKTRLIQPATVNREISLLSAIYVFGIRTGRISPPYNPCTYLKGLPENNMIQREITDADLEKICLGAEWHSVQCFLLARFTGLRHSALLALDWSQINEAGVVYPSRKQLKEQTSKRIGRVPIRAELWPVIGERKTKGPVIVYRGKPIRRLENAIFLARKRAGFYFRLHDLRAAFQTELLRAGVNEVYYRILMGHGKDLSFAQSVTERYARVSDDDLIKVVSALPSCQTLVEKIIANCKKK